jgi:hypothetical protein
MTPWICTLKHDITLTGDLSANVVDIFEIANSLARINRFTGHIYANWSVAQHSLLVLNLAMRHHPDLTPRQARALLLHDAHEAYTGDVASPIKLALGEAWTTFEHAHAQHVHQALGLTSTMVDSADTIGQYDRMALRVERFRLLGRQGKRRAWPVIDGTGNVWTEPQHCDLEEMLQLQADTPNRRSATEAFLTMYQRVTADALSAGVH